MSRILVADEDEAIRDMVKQTLESDGFEVVTVGTVGEALAHIATEKFDGLFSELHLPRAGDGFTVISAMRHTHPHAATLLLSGFPLLDEVWDDIRLQVDEVLVKPFDIALIREAIREKIKHPGFHRAPPKETVATILERDLKATITNWIALVNQDEELVRLPLSFNDRTGHLPNLIAEVISRLRLPPVEKAGISVAARRHGTLRRQQGYTAPMIVEESRILQVSIFNTLQTNLPTVDFTRVLLDVMVIADEVDSQLKQAMMSFVDAA